MKLQAEIQICFAFILNIYSDIYINYLLIIHV